MQNITNQKKNAYQIIPPFEVDHSRFSFPGHRKSSATEASLTNQVE